MTNTNLYNGLRKFKSSYLKSPIAEKDLKTFIKQLFNYYNEVSSNQDKIEEYLKNVTNDFLKNSFYFDNEYRVNTQDKIDSAILKNNKVQVLLEFKRPNSNEMPKQDNINKKALHEAVLYYINERQNNDELKYIIITDTINWFIFNAHDFEHVFYSKLHKKFDDFKAGKLVDTNNPFFYKVIQEHFEDNQETLDYIYFNLDTILKKENINNVLDNLDKYKEIKHLYRFFNPEFLLKEYSQKDTNTLNKGFYDELLYLMGLKEIKEGGKLLIVRDAELEGSLLNSTYSKLIDDKDLPKNEKTESLALELVLTWINRILFIKLFESQLILFNKNSENKNSYEILNSTKIKKFSELRTLFFKILNTKLSDREEQYKDYKFIPYLNSSLFELTELESKYFSIADIENNDLNIYNSSNLKSWDKYKKLKRQNLLEYLLDFLQSFDFSFNLDDSDIKAVNKDIINASVLGLIFEKINGYKDGSIYTPGCITEYMSKQSIEQAIINKFNEKYQKECKDIEEVRFVIKDNFSNKEKRKEINDLINSLKICDPAVGSGHFLVSALNQLLATKFYLGAMFRCNSSDLLNESDCNIEIENDTLIITDAQGEFYNYNKSNKFSQIIQETIFHEKKELIENCLFGVDINPKSVYLCRLRLWIELLKHTYYKTDGTMETLPNIDINIKTGNSLINKLSFEVGRTKLSEFVDETLTKKLINNYKKAVKEYKDTSIKEHKKSLNNQIKDMKDKITGMVQQLSLFEANTNKDHNEIYRNSMEWAIEFPEVLDEKGTFLGFDIVIGNPPYGIMNKKQNKKEAIIVPSSIFDYYKNSLEYKPAVSGAMNIFKLFIVKSFSLLKKDGIFSEIFPLAFIADSNAKNLREYILSNNNILNIEAFPERDNEKKRVFEHAKISVCILNAKKNKIKGSSNFFIRVNKDKCIDDNTDKVFLNYKILKLLDAKYLTIPLITEPDLNLLIKIFKNSVKLETFAHCYTGEIDLSINKDLLTRNSLDSEMIKGAIIDKYIKRNTMSQGEILYLNSEKYLVNNTSEKATHHKKERIVMQGITGVNEKNRLKMTYLPPNIFCANSVNYIIFNNNSINPKYVLALLNSKLLNYIFIKFSTNSNVNGYEVDALPLKFSDNYLQEKLVEITNNILNLTSTEGYFENQEKQKLVEKYRTSIDEYIYKDIYNLTSEEINLVEGK